MLSRTILISLPSSTIVLSELCAELGLIDGSSSAHNSLNTIVEDGREIKIVRDNMPFGRVGQGELCAELGLIDGSISRSDNLVRPMMCSCASFGSAFHPARSWRYFC